MDFVRAAGNMEPAPPDEKSEKICTNICEIHPVRTATCDQPPAGANEKAL